MKAVVFLATAAATVALLGSAALNNGSQSRANVELDRIIGDGGFNTVYPIQQARHDVQKTQYIARLRKIVDLLGSRDVSDMPAELQAERARNLKRLLEYRDHGVFPVNYDHPGAFLPCFIDSTGAICAAGYLVEQSAGRDLAEAINREYKYATIAQIDSPLLDQWIARSGFSRAEIATIQGPSIEPEEQISIASNGEEQPASRNRRAVSRGRAITRQATPDTVLMVAPTDRNNVPRAVDPELVPAAVSAPATPVMIEPARVPAASPEIGDARNKRSNTRNAIAMVRR